MNLVLRAGLIFRGMVVFVGALAIATAPAIGAASRATDFEISIGPRQTLTYLALPVEIPHGTKKVYGSYMRALEIVRISVDGDDLQPFVGFTFHSLVPSAQIESGAKTYIYWLAVEEGISWCPSPQDMGTLRKGMYVEVPSTSDQQKRYRVLEEGALIRLPPTWSQLRLLYKIRFPDGSKSREMSMIVTRSSDA